MSRQSSMNSPRAARDGRAVIARWNELQRAFSSYVETTDQWAAPPTDLADPRFYGLFLSAIAALEESDPRNLPMEPLLQRLDLPEPARSQLAQSGLKNFRELAQYLRVAPALERQTELRSQLDKVLPPRARAGTLRLPFDRQTRELIEAAVRKAWSKRPAPR